MTTRCAQSSALTMLRGCASVLAISVVLSGSGSALHAEDITISDDQDMALIRSTVGQAGDQMAGTESQKTDGQAAEAIDVTISATGTVGDTSGSTQTQIHLSSTGGTAGRYGPNDWTQSKAGVGSNGGDGGSLTLTVDGTIRVADTGAQDGDDSHPLILLETTGAAGGNPGRGTEDNAQWHKARKGGNGGKGGDIGVTLGAAVQTIEDANPLVVAVSTGGKGGPYVKGDPANNGGNGGTVAARLAADGSGKTFTVGTSGDNAQAFVLKSVGGAAGTSGSDIGNSSKRGKGGDVTFTAEAGTRVRTTGNASTAILLQSVGGRGGDGNSDAEDAVAGGDAGNVTATLDGSVETTQDYAFGIVAQSVAGDGGDGYNAFAASGGDGGDAGAAGTVTITNAGDIGTRGDGSTAIVAQSIGGGDPMAAFDSTKGTYVAGGGGDGGGGGWWFWSHGGDGGRGGAANTVTVSNYGTIATQGDGAYGILAQSIGGNGGNGGGDTDASFFVSVSIGGDGGPGGDGADVEIGEYDAFDDTDEIARHAGSRIETRGNTAYGILAQSVGGGGGNGGAANSNSLGPVISVSVAVGGSGGDGGHGGAISVANMSDITTNGDAATAILAQSVGGGGGAGGGAKARSISVGVPKLPSISVSTAIGGTGGGGGDGGTVRIRNRAAVTTHGSNANAIEAQSIGGGGGAGGNATAQTLAVQYASTIDAVSVAVSVGGSGGKGGHGGDVEIEVADSKVETTGDQSSAIVARSIGGGGGSGGAGSSLSQLMSYANAVTTSVAIGGTGSSGGDGGAVTVEAGNSDITTYSDFSYGIYALSVGGGGGDGGSGTASAKKDYSNKWLKDSGLSNFVSLLKIKADDFGVGVAVGGSSDGGGHGGDVTIDQSGSILTVGDNSAGIVARSIGGGGGDGGGYNAGASAQAAITTSVGGSGGAGGDGGNIAITHNGSVTTQGGGSHGVFAQSVGGGGGTGGSFSGSVSHGLGDELNAFEVFIDILKDVDSWNDLLSTFANSDDKDSIFNGNSKTQHAFETMDSLIEVVEAVEDLATADADEFWKALANFMSVEIVSLIKVGKREALEAFQKRLKDKLLKGDRDIIASLPSVSEHFSFGGSGGKGGHGGDVQIHADGGSVVTSGVNAFGVFAQSIGGGGGAGGSSYASGSNTFNLDMSIGGSGGVGGKGGTVTIENLNGTVLTTGDGSHAIYAQSVGGGGGVGGASQTSNSISFSANLVIGGDDGAQGDGGDVSVTNGSRLGTTGAGAHGIVAQSIGGGGGRDDPDQVGRDDPGRDRRAEEHGYRQRRPNL
ncbi:hypothetical protein [Chachezhania sediminis]|uniref:hypothetical protein n=1 Tax=Chachezhania sediminis TaxID=2599291 RepID=UPI00131BC462|nr:hypothetical protein [Chachezhania sediminis]